MDAGGYWLALLAVNAHSQLKIIGYLLRSVFTKTKKKKKAGSVISQDKNIPGTGSQ